ncbi:hypothetical protein ACO0SA_002901 [Hanseniaspora valbyensis]
MNNKIGKNLSNNINHILKKSYDINKLLKGQIKYELQFTNLPFSQKNQFRLLIENNPSEAHTKNMVLYKKFDDKSLNKSFEMFIKVDVSKILNTDYAIEPNRSFEAFKKYVKNYYDKKNANDDNSGTEFMAIDEDEYNDIKDDKEDTDIDQSIYKNAEEYTGNNDDHDATMKKRINQLEEFKDGNGNMVSFFDEFFNEQQRKNYDDNYIENPFEGIYASQFIPLDIIVRDINAPQNELLLKSLLDLSDIKLFVEKIAVLKDEVDNKSNTNIIIPKWFTNDLSPEKQLRKNKHNLGPSFVFFDPKMQESFYELLKLWGIIENEKFINDIYEKAEEREQALYVAWLFKLSDFFAPKTKKKK